MNGWAIQPKNPDDVLRTDTDWEAQAVSLDSLIGFGDEEPVDLGRITGVHHDTSHRSGVLRTSESVFDPTTRTVTPASQYPGLAGARTGIDTTIREGKQSRALVIRPGDGSAGLTIPIEPGSVSFPVEEKEPASSEPEKKTIFLNAPGVTLVALDPENGIEHQNSKDGDYIHTHTHRLYGVTGGSA